MTRPIASGVYNDVASRLAELDVLFREAGIDTSMFSARELCLLPKAQPLNKFYAIPPASLWPSMVATIVAVAQPIRLAFGAPCSIKGYRPHDYNLAVTRTKANPRGTPGSAHIYFEAIDMRPLNGKVSRLRAIASDLWIGNPDLPMGLGLYAGNIHVDFGTRPMAARRHHDPRFSRRHVWGSQKIDIVRARERAEVGDAASITAVRSTGEWRAIETLDDVDGDA